jgi:predicted ester cyclase
MPVRSPGSIVVGNAGVIAATMATLAEFPDRRLLGEDVIWCEGNDEGYLSSHRILSTATHAAAGVYGAPTGRKVRYRIIADCYARANVIEDEWLVRDQGAIVRQLGLHPRDYARDLIEREGGPESCVRPYLPENDVAGPYTGRGNDNEWGVRYADVLTRLMQAEFSLIPKEYDRAVQAALPGGETAAGHEEVDAFWLGLRASLPSATFTVHHVIGREDRLMPPRAAVRWSLDGQHDGWGSLGTPTGARVHVMGISHAEFGPRGLRREVTLFDETAIFKQILLATG